MVNAFHLLNGRIGPDEFRLITTANSVTQFQATSVEI